MFPWKMRGHYQSNEVIEVDELVWYWEHRNNSVLVTHLILSKVEGTCVRF